VRTVRGRRGGIILQRPADDIVIADLVQATEDNLAIVPCFDPGDTSCPLYQNCALGNAFNDALGAFFATLRQHTLADLL
jgi:Rrf2 family transcriptional regulator, nitric oxide-sensitive transcriptional repressor